MLENRLIYKIFYKTAYFLLVFQLKLNSAQIY